MQILFIPSWILFLGESMSVWINKFTCPGSEFFPLAPHPKSNEYHTIFCGKIVIMYVWGGFEGKDHQIPMGRPKFEMSSNTKTVGLVL